jgi:hypothetical protein
VCGVVRSSSSSSSSSMTESSVQCDSSHLICLIRVAENVALSSSCQRRPLHSIKYSQHLQLFILCLSLIILAIFIHPFAYVVCTIIIDLKNSLLNLDSAHARERDQRKNGSLRCCTHTHPNSQPLIESFFFLKHKKVQFISF